MGPAAIRGEIANWTAVHHSICGGVEMVLLLSGAHLPRMIFHPFLAAHASAKMLIHLDRVHTLI
jgi:hypothetical protein